MTEPDRQRELERQFLDAHGKRRPIFSPHVFDELEKVWTEGNNLYLYGMAIKLGQDDLAPCLETLHRLLQ